MAYDAGSFRVFSVGELDALAAAQPAAEENSPVFEIHVRSSAAQLPAVEVSCLQAASCNGALFQVASNFNCIENAHHSIAADCGEFLTFQMVCAHVLKSGMIFSPLFEPLHLQYDHTQGPAAASGASFSALTRANSCWFTEGGDPSTWGQTRAHTIDLLGHPDIAPHFGVVNGKALATPVPAELAWPPAVDVRSLIRCGLHCDVRPHFRRVNGSSVVSAELNESAMAGCIFNPRPPRIDQVFGASLNLHQTSGEPKPRLSAKLDAVLAAAYEATYAAAVVRHSPELVLTLIGGGVFSNPLPRVAAAMAAAHARYANQSRLRRVVLPLFPVNADAQPFVDALAAVGVCAVVVRH